MPAHRHAIVACAAGHRSLQNDQDTYGHLLGDVVLQRVVALANHQLRSGDVVGRYGGEEFVLVLPNTLLDHAHVVAERVRSEIAYARFVVEGTSARQAYMRDTWERNYHKRAPGYGYRQHRRRLQHSRSR